MDWCAAILVLICWAISVAMAVRLFRFGPKDGEE